MHISGATAVYGIVGDPVAHSLSPSMQNAAFEAVGLDCVYVPFLLTRGAADVAAVAVRRMGLCGLNVTVPHKVDIIPFLDSLDPSAQRVGAVNTVVKEEGKLRGYNTDAPGFARSLDSFGVDVKCKEVLVLGAGGAARAVVSSLLELGARVVVLNRDVARAQRLARDVAAEMDCGIACGTISDSCLEEHMPGCALLVNTTSVGMYPNCQESPCPPRFFHRDLTVCDIVYNPTDTLLLSEARKCGARVITGDEMLVQQGALAFELWMGITAPVEIMRSKVREELGRGAQ